MSSKTICKITNHLEQAYAFFNKNGDLEYYNSAFLELWQLNKEVVDELKPSIADFFSMIIENSMLLITESPSLFIKNILQVVAQQELNISKTIICKPNKVVNEQILSLEGGVLFIWKDNTLINNLNKETSIVNSNINQIIKNLPIPILFIESNGKIIEKSNVFNQLLDIFCTEGMHIREVLDKLQSFFTYNNDLNKLLESIFKQQEYSNRFKNKNGDTVYLKVVPMVSSKLLLVISLEQNEVNILENIDLIKQSLNENYQNIYLKLDKYINNHLTSSKNYIELVANQYTGELNKKQVSFLQQAQKNIDDIASYILYHVENINIENINEQKSNINIQDTVTNNIIALKNEISLKNIQLSIETTSDISVYSYKNYINKLIKLIITKVISTLPYKGILQISNNSNNFLTLKHNCQSVLFAKSHAMQDVETIFVLNILKTLKVEMQQTQDEHLREITLKINL